MYTFTKYILKMSLFCLLVLLIHIILLAPYIRYITFNLGEILNHEKIEQILKFVYKKKLNVHVQNKMSDMLCIFKCNFFLLVNKGMWQGLKLRIVNEFCWT